MLFQNWYLLGEKNFQAALTEQDLGFSKFPTSTPRAFHMGVPLSGILSPTCPRYYLSSGSEMYGKVQLGLDCEKSLFSWKIREEERKTIALVCSRLATCVEFFSRSSSRIFKQRRDCSQCMLGFVTRSPPDSLNAVA